MTLCHGDTDSDDGELCNAKQVSPRKFTVLLEQMVQSALMLSHLCILLSLS